jgi:hypothetical protein
MAKGPDDLSEFSMPPNGREPKGEFLPGRRFELHEPVVYYSGMIIGTSRVGSIMVEAGTISDFASVPRFFWRLISPFDDDVRLPAIVHDSLYTSQVWEKDVADLIFREALQVRGAPAWKVFAMYNAVKWFGKKAWNDHKATKARQHPLPNTPSFIDP